MDLTRNHLTPLTGLRGIAALSIILGHSIAASFIYDGGNPFQPFAGRLCYFAMSLFFILSGFVIYVNYANSITMKGMLRGGYDFFVARFARLYPLYALAFLFVLDRFPSVLFHNKQWGELAYLTLTQSWFNLQNITFPPAWSISTECFFYAFFVLFLPVFEKIRKPFLTLIIFTTLSFLFLPPFLHAKSNAYPGLSGWLIYFSPFIRVFEFITGILAAKVYLSMDANNFTIKPVAANILMMICVGWCSIILAFDIFSSTQYSVLLSNYVYAPALAPLLILACRSDNIISRVLCMPSLLFLGEISYSLYLWQFTIISSAVYSYTVRPNHVVTFMTYFNSVIKVIMIIAITTLLAYGSYQLYEKPMRRYIRKRLALKENVKTVEVVPQDVVAV